MTLRNVGTDCAVVVRAGADLFLAREHRYVIIENHVIVARIRVENGEDGAKWVVRRTA